MDGDNGEAAPSVRITKQILKSVSGEFDIESIHSLVLRGSGISELGCLGECLGLERLDLSRNDLSKLYALAGLSKLTYLNLSANRISSLEGLQALDNLMELNVAGNLIGSMDTLRCLSSLEKLDEVRLQDLLNGLSNPICMNTSYKKDVLEVLTTISTLDGERVRGRGMQLSQACDELDELLKRCEQVNTESHESMSGPWVDEGYWQSTKPCPVDLQESEKQLTDMLAECKAVQEKADNQIKQLSKALANTENDLNKT